MPLISSYLLLEVAVKLPSLHFAFSFNMYRAEWLTYKIALDQFVGGARNLNRSVTAVRFHAAGGVLKRAVDNSFLDQVSGEE